MRAPVGEYRAAGEAGPVQFGHRGREPGGDLVPDRAEAAAGRQHAHRIDAEIEIVGGEVLAPGGGEVADPGGRLEPPPARVEAQADEGEHDAGQGRFEARRIGHGQAVAPGAGCPGEGQDQGVRSALQVGQGLFRGGGGIGVIDPLGDPPRARRPHRLPGGLGRFVERLDPQAVRRAGDELLLEIGTLQRRLDQGLPTLAVGRLEKFGERSVVHRFGRAPLMTLRAGGISPPGRVADRDTAAVYPPRSFSRCVARRPSRCNSTDVRIPP